ncbi:MAG TPA: hypothetical protein VKY19_22570 [Ktedonosporobacter sp.]|jgi:hypothetical protein|nr:hypothetical protein [Ktedonosporobacter sp.]
MMQQTKRPVPADDDAATPLDNHLEEGEDGVLPEFPTQPFQFIPPTGRSPVPPHANRPRVSQALPDQQQSSHSCQRVRQTEDHNTTTPAPQSPFMLQQHPWDSFLVGMLLCLILFLVGQQVVLPFVTATADQWHYGDAQLSQLDADVGHGGMSHLIANYYHGYIVVIEILLSHPQDNRVYVLSGFRDLPTPPVLTLGVQDLNGDGKPDLLIKIEGTALQAVLFNAGKTFQGQGG